MKNFRQEYLIQKAGFLFPLTTNEYLNNGIINSSLHSLFQPDKYYFWVISEKKFSELSNQTNKS